MSKIKTNALFAICIASIMQCVSAAGGFVIENYHVDMQLTTSGSMYVQEYIDVNFSEKRHGIYRTIPVVDKAGDFLLIENFKVVGAPIASEEIDGDNYTLKIGDPNSKIEGKKSYKISYTVQNPIKRYLSGSNSTSGSWQELYWNVIGHEWESSIQKASFTVTLPKPQRFATGQIFLYYGSNGEKNTFGSYIIQTTTGLVIGEINKSLNPAQGATIGLQFPDSYFAIDSTYYEMFASSHRNQDVYVYNTSYNNGIDDSDTYVFVLVIGFFAFIMFIILYTIIKGFFNKGTDGSYWQSKNARTIYYTPPPQPISPISFYFWYFSNEPKIFAAIIYHWASSGFITISKSLHKNELMKKNPGKTKEDIGLRNWIINMSTSDNKVYLIKSHDAISKADEREQMYIDTIFRDQDSITLDSILYSDIELLFGSIFGDLVKENLYTSKMKFLQLHYNVTAKGNTLFEHIRGYKFYLEKVEKKVLSNELKNNPDLVNTLLPWATLFGQESKILEIVEELMIPISWYDHDESISGISDSFSTLTTGLVMSAVSPSHGSDSNSGGSDWSSSSDSGFSSSSGGGSSGGGGGGGGGGSW